MANVLYKRRTSRICHYCDYSCCKWYKMFVNTVHDSVNLFNIRARLVQSALMPLSAMVDAFKNTSQIVAYTE